MAVVVKFEGGRELERALGELPKATARNTLNRVLMKAAENMDDIASGFAPVDTGQLQRSVVTGKRLTQSQSRQQKKDGKHFAEVHVGTEVPTGIFQEFGTFKEPAQPFMRPSWDSTKVGALKTIQTQLGIEIEKSRARLAKKAAKFG